MSTSITNVPPVEKQPTTVPKRKFRDPQTGEEFEVEDEGPIDVVLAWISALYSLAVITYLAWVVVGILWRHYGPKDPVELITYPKTLIDQLAWMIDSNISKLVLYTAVGGAMGAAVNNLRSFITWHAERKAFGWRFIWKYLALPPLGATLAVLVYGILQGGMAVFNGGNVSQTAVTSLSAWATGTLAGYGSHKVFKWLDDKVNALFKTDVKQVAVPDVVGKLLDEAQQIVRQAQLQPGSVTQQTTTTEQIGKVLAQAPESGTQIDCGSKVDLIVGIAATSGTPDVSPPLKATTQNGNGTAATGTDQPVKLPETTPVSEVKGSDANGGNGSGTLETPVEETEIKTTETGTDNTKTATGESETDAEETEETVSETETGTGETEETTDTTLSETKTEQGVG
jgi:PASTA domain-containing protein